MTAGPLTLYHISDLHFGLEDQRALDFFKVELARERPAAVLITGDLTMRARHREFAAASAWISALDVPVTVEVGNHDMPYFNLIERFVDPYRRFHAIESLVERELQLPGLAIVPLKTATRAQWRFPWSNGWVTSRALAECCAAIDALPQGTRAIVTAHHPLTERSPAGKHLTIGGTHAMEALAARGVFAVLTTTNCLWPAADDRGGHAFAADPLHPCQLQRAARFGRYDRGRGSQHGACANRCDANSDGPRKRHAAAPRG
jgi:hypothetical protein